jgi:hypothetical protein
MQRNWDEQNEMPTLEELGAIKTDDPTTWPGGPCGHMGTFADRLRGRNPASVREAARDLVDGWYRTLESQLDGQMAPELAQVDYLIAVLRKRTPQDPIAQEALKLLDNAVIDLEMAAIHATARNTLALARSGFMPSAAWFASPEVIPDEH